MKNRFILIYTIFATAVFIFAISFFGFNLFREYKTNLEKSDIKFTELVNNVRTLSYNKSENDASYIKGIKDYVGDPSAYSFIHIRRDNETVIFYPTGKSREETVSKLTRSFTENLTVNKQPLFVDCNIYLIRPDSIFYYARTSFLMILIITIITIIMIIYLNISENTSDVISFEENDEEEAEEEKEGFADTEITETSKEVTEDTVEEKQATAQEEESETTEVEAPQAESTTETEATPESDAQPEIEEESHAEVTPEEVQAILSEPLTDAQTQEAKLPLEEVKPAALDVTQDSDSNEPAGLYNPETGIGWESYLSVRLNNEIDRSTASEIDLALFIIKLINVEKTSEIFKNVCNYLTIQFQFKDLLFEYKDDCIVAIKISMNVDEALNLADKLYADICNIINSKDCRIGISSRSIRMVAGDRLILEAEQAIEHSDSTSPVIAFRVDSEKYRQLMESNQ